MRPKLPSTIEQAREQLTEAVTKDCIEIIRGKATIPIWPDAAGVLGISRNSAYKAAADGSLPTLRFGNRLVVPVPKLIAMLGAD